MSKIRHRSDIHIEGHLSASSADFGGLVSFAEDLAISGTLQFQHMSASSARIGESLVVGEDATVSGSFKVGNSMTVRAKEAESAYILLQADDSDDAGDDWKLTAGSTFTIGNDIASAGSDVAHVTITPHATVASSTTAVAGILTTGGVIKVGGNKIQASDGGDTITLDTSDNVTVAGDLTVGGGDATIGTAGNTTATTIITVTNTGTNAGKDLTISAGSSTTNGNNINGGNLILKAGGGDGTGTSAMTFFTKVNGTDAAAERVRIHTDGNVGIGTAAPGANLHVAGDDVRIRADGDSNSHPGFELSENGTRKWIVYNNYTNDNLDFKTDSDIRMSIEQDGNVGIGTESPNCKLHVAGAAAFSGPSETFVTFGSSDTTPSVATGNLFKTHASGQTLTMFDGGVAGQIINVISTAAVVYDVTGTNLKGGSADITTASGDVTTWVFDGTNWYLLNFMDVSADLSGGH